MYISTYIYSALSR